mmetsp:Transcript_7315/g.8006  ORF Transcript_7315/g.8006 Transcript_7315/m.8006 type:complete len:102 (+) Transcript_7315:314-619(+)
MKTVSAFYLSLILGGASAFQSSSINIHQRKNNVILNAYIPDGFTKESYAKFKEQEKKKQQKQNLGRMGPKGFKSRSFQSFQEALERGEADHLMPVFNAKER